MGYHVIDPDDVEPAPGRPSTTRFLSDAAGMENMGLRRYEVEPGEDIPFSGMHYHDEQEEVFYVVEGQLRVETPDREYRIESGQLFVAEPESPHRAFNAGGADATAVVLGIGAPPVEDGHVYEG